MSYIFCKFVEYTDVLLFKAVTLVVYSAAINLVRMSIKEMGFVGNK